MLVDIVLEETKEIKLMPKTEVEEVMQNVYTIITTARGSVALDRDFGIDTSFLDAPINVAQTLMLTSVIEAVSQFEPRAKVKEILFGGEAKEGKLEAKVRVEYVG